MPENSENETDALIHFTSEFSSRWAVVMLNLKWLWNLTKLDSNNVLNKSRVCVYASCRYGETHPMFFIGSLEAASQEAFHGKARDVSNLLDYFGSHRNIFNILWKTCVFLWSFIFLSLLIWAVQVIRGTDVTNDGLSFITDVISPSWKSRFFQVWVFFA